VLLPPESPFSCPGEPESLNPTKLTVVAAPFCKGGNRTGIVELFFQPFSSFNAAWVEHLALWIQAIFDSDLSLDLRDASLIPGRLEADEMRAARALSALHEAADPIAVVITLANQARRIIGCDRVSVLIRRRRRFSLEAISGSECVDRRSLEAMALEALAWESGRHGQVWWRSVGSQPLPPLVEVLAEDLAEQSRAGMIAMLPLLVPPSVNSPGAGVCRETAKTLDDAADTKKHRLIGALCCEWATPPEPEAEAREWAELFAHHGAIALANANNRSLTGAGLNLLRIMTRVILPSDPRVRS
jgi:hypothetical protein